jgi:23S rRNA (adenine2503-C2)-methyltransferase
MTLTAAGGPTLAVVSEHGDGELARVFVARTRDGALIEFVESVQPPIPREEKWVLIVSTLKGCPIACPICDAGGDYRGRLTADEILGQVEFLVRRRYPKGRVTVPKLKVQFARMGDPALNDAVITALEELPSAIDAPGLMACVSTIAPVGRERFFEELLRVKRERYRAGRFQMQFSLHTTDSWLRRRLVPARTWGFAEMAAYGRRFFEPGDRKITLNFAAAEGLPLDPAALRPHFDPSVFLTKLTPINPTAAAARAGLRGAINPDTPARAERIASAFRRAGYETILSIGELRENVIGSNCGMFVARMDGPAGRGMS